MSKRHWELFVNIFLIFALTLIASPQLLFKRETDECNDLLSITGCDDETFTFEEPFSKLKPYRLASVYRSNCTHDKIKYQWFFKTVSKQFIFPFSEKNFLDIEPFFLETGAYAVGVRAEIYRKNTKKKINFHCAFSIKPEKPVPVIKGGSERIVEAGFGFVVDGSKSIDRDVPPHKEGNLIYQWNCQVLQGKVKDFCEKDYTGSIVEVPPKFAFKDYKYIFTLKVKTKNYNEWQSATQIITVLVGVIEVEIICEKNCPPASPKSDSNKLTFLRVKCLKNCASINENSYLWTVEGMNNFNYDQWTHFGRKTDKFVVNPGIFQSGTKYKIKVDIVGKVGGSVKIIEPQSPPKIESCEVKPPQGIAIKTEFKSNCKYTGDISSFQIYITKNGRNTDITESGSLGELDFFLPSDADVYIKILDENNIEAIQKLSVTVKPVATGNDEEYAKEFDQLIESVRSMIKEKNFDEASETAVVMLEEIYAKRTSMPTFYDDIIEKILKIFEDISSGQEQQNEISQFSSAVSHIVYEDKAERASTFSKIATKLCRIGADVNLNNMNNEQFPKTLTSKTKNISEMFMNCIENNIKPNLELLEPVPLPFNITTPFPVITFPVITEDYPDYLDFSVMDKIKNFEIGSENVIGICKSTVTSMSLTLVEGEKTFVASTQFCLTSVTKEIGNKLAGREIKMKEISIFPPDDLKSITDPVEVTVCSWSKNPFWWNDDHQFVFTNVILMQIKQLESELVKFKAPFRIIMDAHVKKKQVKVHEIYDENFKDFSIIRVDVKKGESFFVKFENLTNLDSFKILITDFVKPELTDLQRKGRNVSNTQKNLFYQDNKNDYDTWHYISILPSQPKLKKLKYSISVFTISCYSWDTSRKNWNFSCIGTSKSNLNKIECECKHLSILAGMIYNLPIKIDSQVIDPDFEMVLLHSIIVYVCLFVAFSIYCFSLLLILKNYVDKGQRIFLLADISLFSRFLYLVQIRTGKKLSAGTTSNVCIKIFGSKANSQSHLLNYPDPHQRILQWGNEDWFVLPTDYHLGIPKEIAVWSDCSGRSPSWFCKDITVYDLQTNQSWCFKINNWFYLPPDGQPYIKVNSFEEDYKEKFSFIWKFWPQRSHRESLTIFTKTTLLFSITLTMFLSCFIMYGMPSLRLKDGFATFKDYELYPKVIGFGIACAVITFTIHIPLAWFIKNVKKYIHYYWIFLIINIVASMSILLVFGFWLPTIMEWLWLTSIAIGILTYLILENIYEIVLLNVYQKITEDYSWFLNLKSILAAIEKQREYLFRKFGVDLLRPYFLHLYRPLKRRIIKKKILNEEFRKNMVTMLEDTVMFTIYVTLLYLAIYANRSSLTILNNQQMLDILSGVFMRMDEEDASEVTTLDEFYDYVNLTLIPTLQSAQWYNKYVVQEPGMIVDFHNKYLGVVRIRQQRSVTNSCTIPKMMLFFKDLSCRSEFWQSEQNYHRFGYVYNDMTRLYQAWSYTSAEVAGYSINVGKFGTYLGGGYIALLGRTMYNSIISLDYLKENEWLDRNTRVIFIEFLTYNVNSNLFSAIRMMIEKSVSGYMRTIINVDTTQLLFLHGEEKSINSVITASFFLILSIFAVKIIWRIWRKKSLLFLKDLWTLVDLFIVAMSYGCFGITLNRTILVKEFLETIETSKKNDFVNYFNLFYIDIVFTLVAAFLVFVSTIRLWKFFRFATIFRIVEKTFILFAPLMLALLLCHMIIILSFTFTGNLLFGGNAEDFKDIPDTMVTMITLSLCLHETFDFDALTHIYPLNGVLYYTIYMVLSLLICTIYITMITVCYYEAQLIYSNGNEFSLFKEWIKDEFNYCKILTKVTMSRLKGGANLKRRKYVTPKAKEHRFADCMTLETNKIELMRCVALNNLNSLSDEKKIDLMGRIIRCLQQSQENEIFFKIATDNNKVKLIHNNKFKKMEDVTELILSNDDNEEEEEEENENVRKDIALKYEKIINRQMKQLNYIHNLVTTMLRIISNIDVI